MFKIERAALRERAVAMLRIVATILVATVALDVAAYIVADRTIPVIDVDGAPTPIVDVRQWVSVVMWSGSLFLAISLASLLLLERLANGLLGDRTVAFVFAQSIVMFSACILLLVVLYADGSAAARIPASLGVDLAAYQLSEEVEPGGHWEYSERSWQ